MGLPAKISDDLAATVKRLAPAIPQVAALFGIEVEEGASMPRPLRNNPAKERREKKAAANNRGKAEKPADRTPKANGPDAPNAEAPHAEFPEKVSAEMSEEAETSTAPAPSENGEGQASTEDKVAETAAVDEAQGDVTSSESEAASTDLSEDA